MSDTNESETPLDAKKREERLIALHDAVTEVLIARMQDGDLKAADITAAINHLKANGIEASSSSKAQGPIRKLYDSLPFVAEAGGDS